MHRLTGFTAVVVSLGSLVPVAKGEGEPTLDLVAELTDNPFLTDLQGMPIDEPRVGQPVNVNVNFTYGVLGGVSPPVTVTLTVDGIEELCTVTIPPTSDTTTVTCPWLVRPGFNKLCGIVDPENQVAEIDETNNTACFTVGLDCNLNGESDAVDVRNLVGTNPDFYLRIDPMTGTATTVSGLGLGGFQNVEGLTFDPNTNTLYGTNADTDQLIVIDQATGVATAVGLPGFSNVQGLAFDPNTNTLYGTNGDIGRLITIDPTTGAESVGVLNLGVDDLAFDPNTNTLYGTNTNTGRLLIIDPTTGTDTAVGTIGFSGVVGLAFDPNTNTLYGADTNTNQLITIDTTTGAGTAVGALGFLDVSGLAFDPNTNTLYGTDNHTEQLLTINTATGAGTAVGPPGFRVISLTFDPNTNTLYGTTNSNQLITIDPITGAGTVVGALGFGVIGLAFDPNTNTLYGTTSNQLITIDPITGAGTAVGPLGLVAQGLAFDPNTNTLYGTTGNQLLTINPATGAGTAVGTLGFFGVVDLAFDLNTNTLYGTDMLTNQLLTINPTTGMGTGVAGVLAFDSVWELAFDPNTNTLYGTGVNTSQLLTINPATGTTSAVGTLGYGGVRSLAFDTNTNTVYGVDTDTDILIRIDPATGASTAVGPVGFSDVECLAFDPNINRLYGITGTTLITINPVTGLGLLAASENGLLFIRGLAFDPNTNTLYGASLFSGLVTIDPFTGATTPIGPFLFGIIDSLAFDPEMNILYGTDAFSNRFFTIDAMSGMATEVGALGVIDVAGLAFIPGPSMDCDANGIPDECELCGDLDEDEDVDGDDFAILLDAYALSGGVAGFEACADYDHDAIVTLVDYQQWLLCYRDFIGDPSALPPQPGNAGDMDGNGVVDGRDIQSFVDALSMLAELKFRDRFVADINWDGSLDAADVGPFVEIVLGNR